MADLNCAVGLMKFRNFIELLKPEASKNSLYIYDKRCKFYREIFSIAKGNY